MNDQCPCIADRLLGVTDYIYASICEASPLTSKSLNMSKLLSLSRAGRLWKKRPPEKLPTKDCLLLGHSHTVAVRLAMEEDDAIGTWLDVCTIARENLQPEVALGENGYELHPGLKSRIKAKDYQSLALSIGGGPHVIMGLPQSPEPFDFILPSEPDLPLLKNVRLLAYDAVVETIRYRNTINRNILESIVGCFDGVIFHLDYPPPVPDGWALLHPRAFSGHCCVEVGLSDSCLLCP